MSPLQNIRSATNRLHWGVYLLPIITVQSCVWGFHHTGYEGIFTQFISGAYTEYQDYPIYGFMSHMLTFRLYVWLGSILPGINWASVTNMAAVLLSAMLFTLTAERHLHMPAWLKPLLAFMVGGFFLRHSLFLLDLPWYTMLTCTLSLLTLTWATGTTTTERLSRYTAIGLYLFGLLTRIEAALPVTALTLALHLLLHKNPRHTLRIFYPCLLAFVCMTIALKLDFKYSNDYYKRLEPWAEINLAGGKNLIPLSHMTTAKDSTRYMAITQLVYDDTIQLHETFLRTLVSSFEIMPQTPAEWRHTLYTANQIWLQHLQNIPTSLLLMVLLTLTLCQYLAIRQLRPFLVPVFAAMVLAGLYLVATRGLNQRYCEMVLTYSPLLLLMILLSRAQVQHLQPYAPKLLITAMAISTTASLYAAHQEIAQLKADEQNQQVFMNQLQRTYRGQILILDLYNKYVNNHSPFSIPPYTGFKKVLFHDAVHEMHLANYRSYFQQQCRCDAYNWSSVYQYFYTIRHEAVFVSTPQRIQLKQDFLQKVYGLPYSFQQDKGFRFVSLDGDTLQCYRIPENHQPLTITQHRL